MIGGISYISEELKFTRARYILVAAIVTMILQGVWGICVVEVYEKSITPTLANKDVQGRGPLVVYREIVSVNTCF